MRITLGSLCLPHLSDFRQNFPIALEVASAFILHPSREAVGAGKEEVGRWSPDAVGTNRRRSPASRGRATVGVRQEGRVGRDKGTSGQTRREASFARMKGRAVRRSVHFSMVEF